MKYQPQPKAVEQQDDAVRVNDWVELLRIRAEEQPHGTAYLFLADGETEGVQLSFGELDQRARAIAAHLQRMSMTGQRALLLYPPGLPYIEAFFGCLYAGVVAVPAYPPSRHHLNRLQGKVEDAAPAVVMTTEELQEKLLVRFSEYWGTSHFQWLVTDTLDTTHARAWRPPKLIPESLAFLQYTSGSTGHPKGVMVSHQNLLANQHAIRESFHHTEKTIVVGWLPLYHDMGLIGNILQPLYLGTKAILMSPLTFMEQPVRWLQAISRYRATTSGGPNFAYELCLRKITAEQKRDLDLGTWTVAFNGAESVRATTIERFSAAFAECGFRREAFLPCYGLAEATLFVTGPTARSPLKFKPAITPAEDSAESITAITAEQSKPLVGCGQAWTDHEVKIVDPVSGQACAEGHVGEIWVAGPSVARGYWNRPEESEATFHAHLNNSLSLEGEGGGEGESIVKTFLRTGDLGFLHQGNLYVTGRIKDLIIVHGRNYYPQDLEQALDEHVEALRPGCNAAFSVILENEEHLVIVAEVRRPSLTEEEAQSIFDAMRQALTNASDAPIHAMVLVPPGAVPKTSSGKVQRRACKEAYLGNGLKILVRSDAQADVKPPLGLPLDKGEIERGWSLLRDVFKALPSEQYAPFIERFLTAKVAQLLTIPETSLTPTQSLCSLGLSSLQAVELKHTTETLLGIEAPVTLFLSDHTLVQVAELLASNEWGGGRLEAGEKRTQASSLQPLVSCPLSYAQQAIWTVHQMEPGSVAYNLHLALRIHGLVDPGLLAQALGHLVERHAILRAVYRAEDDAVTQSIVPPPAVSKYLSIVDATAWSESELQEDLGRQVRMPFDLASGPVLRVTLYSHDQNTSTLLCCAHHIAMDLWSLLTLIQDLQAVYFSLSLGRPIELPPIPARYQDFVAWQREYLNSQSSEAAWGYWRAQLSGELPVLALPTDHPRPVVPSYRGASQALALGPELTAKLKALGQRYGATLFMTLLAAYKVLLYRYTHQTDIIVGAPSSGRVHGRFASVVGNFVNPLALCTHPSADLRFSIYLEQVRDTVLGALTHQNFPFPVLIERLQPERHGNEWPIYQTWFVLQQAQSVIDRDLVQLALGEAGPVFLLGDWQIHSVAAHERVENFDLKLMAAECERGLLFSFQYRSDLFEKESITRMAGHFETLLKGIVATPEQPLSELSLLGDTESQQILQGWNATHTLYPEEGWLPQLFERQVDRTPEFPALLFGYQSLTYRELNARASRLAHALRRRGVGPDTIVGLCACRSIEIVVGLLGIIKAGGAYLPFDPDYPQERLATMMEDSNAACVLIQAGLEAALPPFTREVLTLDAELSACAEEPDTNLDVVLHPHDLAYVLYTSGSTGRPKGVAVPHQGIRNRLLWMQQRFGLTEADAVLQKTPYTFDVSGWEFFWPLLAGARLVVAGPEDHKDPEQLISLIERHGVTTLHFVPSMLRVFLEAPSLVRCESLRRVICSGEALSADLQARFYTQFNAELHNLYGPTEASIDVTAWPCRRETRDTTVPIGRPIANTQIYLLDQHFNPVPVGVTGELYIGGVQLARGYLNRPDLTAATFIPDPFGETGGRLYRTGDLARWRADGAVEYLCRIDHQVKVRGFRIELGEIETQLLQHPLVKEAVVFAREDEPGDRRLVAYVVRRERGASKAEVIERLRGYLAETLPDYMVPAAFVFLEVLPLTSSGKLDRKRLPSPDLSAQLAHQYVAPRNEVETALAQIWAEVLRVERVGVYDNFFALGGESILAIQMVSRARQAGLSLTPRQLFQHQTVSELAAVAGCAPAVQSEQGLLSGDVPLTPIQRWFFEQPLPNLHHWNQALLLEVRAPLDLKWLKQAIEHLIVHHDALRLRFVQENGSWRQYYAEEETHLVFHRQDLSDISDQDLAGVIEARSGWWQTQLDLTQGPLLQVVLFDLGEHRSSRLLVVIHHLAVDGVSWRVLLEDLHRVYGQLAEGRMLALPAKTTSFKQWAERLKALAQDESLDEDAAYWLAPSTANLKPLPVDYSDGDCHEHSAAMLTVTLSEADTRALLREAPAVYRTEINDLLLTALAQTLCAWSHSDSVLIDLEGHGREDLFEDLDLSRTVGWFTSVFPVCLSLPTDAAPGSAIKAVKEQLRRIPRKGIGYGLLRYLIDGEVTERLKAQPAASVLFNYLGQFDQALDGSVFALAREPVGPSHDPNGVRAYELEVNAYVAAQRLQLEWRYSVERYREATVVGLAEHYLAALRALIAHCLSPEAGGPTPADFPLASLTQVQLDALPYDPRNIEDIYTLTAMQEGMLFDTLMERHSGIYLMQDRFEVRGHVDEEMFRAAWQRVVDRHPALRTTFVWDTSTRPHQIVHRRVALPFEYLDWRRYSDIEQKARLEALLKAERRQGFDFLTPPLMCIRLLRFSEERWCFVRSYHHILIDAWCTSLILMDLKAHYEALVQGQTAPETLAPPFRAYIAWLQRRDEEATLRFWQRYLQGFTEPTPLVVNGPAAANRNTEPDVSDAILFLTETDTQDLISLAQRHGLTPNTLIQGAWTLLLSRYSGRDEVVFGVTVAGRPTDLAGSAKMLGIFINSLPLRVAVRPAQKILDFLHALLQQNIELRQYEYASLVQIQGWSEVSRKQPLFESLLVFENYPVDPSLRRGEGLLNIVGVETRTHTNYPLNVMVIPGERFHLQITYQQDRFDTVVVERMLGHFKHLLEDIVHHLEKCIGNLEMLPEQEHRQLLWDWNRTDHRYAEPREVVARFEVQVDRTPDAVAVACQGEQLTYRELNSRANRLAHTLIALGIGPDVIVALLNDRGIGFLVMMLGVFKAGGAYLPLDPAYPDARLIQVLQESRVGLVLTGASYRERAQSVNQAVLPASPVAITLTELEESSAQLQDPPCRHAPQNLAFVIFTSGSTGTPKGAMVEHQGMFNNLITKVPTLGITASDVIAQTAGQCFDISVWQHLIALVCGARVEIFPDEVVRDPNQLLQQLVERGTTILETVPSMLQALLDMAGDTIELPSLRWLIACGEAFPPELCRRWMIRFPHIRLLNAYGPAECSDDVSYYPVPEKPGEPDLIVPVGRPVDNTRLYILDRWLNPVPVGVPGEICVAGIQVGRGYLHRPDLTAAVFIPDPFGEASERLYRTGDLGRYRANGTVEFLGRIDHQLKIRGFRIEPGEIEAQLLRHRHVKEAVVLAREVRDGNKMLAAYVVPKEDIDSAKPLELGQLRKYLTEKLPNYMVPAAYLLLPDLPRTATGKIDRKALPEPDGDASPKECYEAPRTPTEEIIAGFWAELLPLDRVGVRDDFFELGGHSLLAIQLMSRMNNAFKVELPLRVLFDAPTVAQLAAVVDTAAAGSSSRPVVPIKAYRWNEKAPLSFAQQRLWFMEQLEPGNPFYNFPTVVRLRGTLNVPALEKGINEIVRRHHVLRAVFGEDHGQAVQFIKPYLWVHLTIEDLTSVDVTTGDSVMLQRVTEAARKPFDLKRGPLLRTHLYVLDPGDATRTPEHVLLINFHHIVFDGWSFGVLIREFGALYPAFSEGSPSPLPELSLQYSDFAYWQQQCLQQGSWDRQLASWRQRLSGSPPLLELPCDRPRSEALSNRGAVYFCAIGKPLTEKLVALCRRQGVTPFMAVTAAFQAMLFYHTGQEDFVVGADVANRNRGDTEQLIGFFVNLLALPADLSRNPAFTELLARVREVTLEAYAHQDLPFDKVVEALRPQRGLNVAPIFQVKVVYHNVPLSDLKLPGLEIAPMEIESNRIELDLVLHVLEGAEGLRAGFEYRTDLFDEASVAGFSRRFLNVLEIVTVQPSVTLEHLNRQLAEQDKQDKKEVGAEQCRRRMDDLHKLKHAKRNPVRISQIHTGGQP